MITDNTAKWKASKITEFAGKALPVGHIHWSIDPVVPVGELPASGYLYNRTLYADLWAYANERGLVKSESEWQAIASANGGNCAYYSSGDGSSTFRVPKLPTTIASDVPSEVPVVGNGMTLGFTNSKQNFGAYITTNGDFSIRINDYGKPIGSETVSSPNPANLTAGITTDPIKSGIVAKTSATKITGQWLIVAFGVAHNIGEADVANVMQAVEQVQTSIGNLKDSDSKALVNYSASVTVSRGFTAPSDGIAFLTLENSDIAYHDIKINDITIAQVRSNHYGSANTIVLPMTKGDVITWETSVAERVCRFAPYK